MSCNNRRIAVRLDRIYDAGKIQDRITQDLLLSNYSPQNPTEPLTYISTSGRSEMTLSNVRISPTTSCKCRVSFDYVLPVTVRYVDARGINGSATSSIGGNVDVVIALPNAPYTISAEGVYSSQIGSIGNGIARSTGCLLKIIRILTKCDVVLNTKCGIDYPFANQTIDINCDETFNNI